MPKMASKSRRYKLKGDPKKAGMATKFVAPATCLPVPGVLTALSRNSLVSTPRY